MIVHNLSVKMPTIQMCERSSCLKENQHLFVVIEISLGSPDVDGSFQLLLAVVVIVHQLTVPQYKPAHLPVSEAEGDNFNKDREDPV